MKITVISDTHTRHKELNQDLPGGDLLICGGDISSRGYQEEIKNFCEWFEIQKYDYKIFIAGNHDWGFQDNKEKTRNLVSNYDITYLEDDLLCIGDDYQETIKIYGSPWQPEFYNWAFNLPRNGEQLKEKWDNIPINTDILITHCPPFGILDVVKGRTGHLGCELLAERVKVLEPKIHIFGHIHTGYGYYFNGKTHFINAAVLNEQYHYSNEPITFDWDNGTNELNFIKYKDIEYVSK